MGCSHSKAQPALQEASIIQLKLTGCAYVDYESNESCLDKLNSSGQSSKPEPSPISTSQEPFFVEETDLPPVQWRLGEAQEIMKNAFRRLRDLRRAAALENSTTFSRIGIIDSTKLWFMTGSGGFTASFPLRSSTGDQLPALINYQNYVNDNINGKCLVVEDLSKDSRFRSHPTVAQRPHMLFYAGFPLISRCGHCLGLLMLNDTSPHPELSEEKIKRLDELSKQIVEALQMDMLRCLGPLADTAFPCVWFDAASPHWTVLKVNKQWEVLTGVSKYVMEACGGLLNVLVPEDEEELTELQAAIAAATAKKAANTSLPSVMNPRDPTGACLQFILALKPDFEAGEHIWVAEVHARAQIHPCPNSSGKALSSEIMDSNTSNVGAEFDYMKQRESNETLEHSSRPSTLGGTPPRDESGHLVRPSPSPALTSRRSSMGSVTLAGLGIKAPARLASLELDKFLGRGSYGIVYAGRLGSGTPVAVKLLEGVAGSDWDRVQWEARFEGMVSLDMHHPNVIETLDWCNHEDSCSGKVWIVQELCNMGSLSDALTHGLLRQGKEIEGKPDLGVIMESALDVARGMQYIHSKNILHADLSSNNVLLTSAHNDRGFMAKVTDFGLSRLTGCSGKATQTFGTCVYMAPELLIRGLMSKSVDVYSFGVLLWEMYANQRAYHGCSLAQVIYLVTVKGATLQMPEGAPLNYATLAHACMSGAPEQRPSFDDIVSELEIMLRDLLEQ